jgi:ParB-like chromosome segregation protein Spo0J
VPEPKKQRLQLSLIRPDPKNPRKHTEANLAAIRRSLADFGQYRPILVNANTNFIVAGHGLYHVMKGLGWKEADCVLLDLTDQQAAELAITDNRTGDLAEWDSAQLCRQLMAAGSIEDFGFDADDLKNMMKKVSSDAEPPVAEMRTIVCPKCSHQFQRKPRGRSKNTTGPSSP